MEDKEKLLAIMRKYEEIERFLRRISLESILIEQKAERARDVALSIQNLCRQAEKLSEQGASKETNIKFSRWIKKAIANTLEEHKALINVEEVATNLQRHAKALAEYILANKEIEKVLESENKAA